MKLFTLGLLISLLGCLSENRIVGSLPADGNEISMQDGVVVYSEIEGGFYVIRAKSGKTYDPINLPESFKSDGIPVKFAGRERPDLVSARMAGLLFELTQIEKK